MASPAGSGQTSRSQSASGLGGSSSSTSTIRPRNKRLVTTELREGDDFGGERTRSESAERNIPRSRLSRNTPNWLEPGSRQQDDPRTERNTGGGWSAGLGRNRAPNGAGNALGKGFLDAGWTGWNAIQGFANSVLAVDIGDAIAGRDASNRNTGRQKAPEEWGPTGSLPIRPKDRVAAGSLEERNAAVRARKMAGVLESHEGVNGGLDVSGRYKKRNSMEQERPQEEESEALVYVHHVQPSDTLAGIVLKYNCEPAVFKKANGLWSNDSIQTRKHVFLPVDACSIRGRPCGPPSPDKAPVDLLAPTPATEDSPNHTNGDPWETTQPQKNPFPDAPKADKTEEEKPWTHVRWVLLSNSPSSTPTEIARLPRKTLGYFPPRRRKSRLSNSTASTPRASLDLTSTASSPSHRTSSNLGADSSNAGSYFPPLNAMSMSPSASTGSLPPPRRRRESISETFARSGWMRGPGGVGTFGKNVRKPGPANDGLNAWAKKHAPLLTNANMPSTSIMGSETAHFGFSSTEELGSIVERAGGSGNVTPSLNAGQSGIGLENAAAAIEGWVRRLAVKGPGTPRRLSGHSTPLGEAAGGATEADLIELLDGAGSEDGRGFAEAVGRREDMGYQTPRDMPTSMPSSAFGGSGMARDDGEGIRGRVMGGRKGKKSD